MNTQSKALRLADQLGARYSGFPTCDEAAAELRRLHELNQKLLEALKMVMTTVDENERGVKGESNYSYPYVVWTATSRAAIAKAEEKS